MLYQYGVPSEKARPNAPVEYMGHERAKKARWNETTYHQLHPHAATRDLLANVHIWPVRIISASSVKQLLHNDIARQNQHCLRAKLQRKDWS